MLRINSRELVVDLGDKKGSHINRDINKNRTQLLKPKNRPKMK